jgi:hypothetical protein
MKSKKIEINAVFFSVIALFITALHAEEKSQNIMIYNSEPLKPPMPRVSGIHEFNNKSQNSSRPVYIQQPQLQSNQDLNRCTQDGGVLTCFNHPNDPRTLNKPFDINAKFKP